jgi:hypothetical protein
MVEKLGYPRRQGTGAGCVLVGLVLGTIGQIG